MMPNLANSTFSKLRTCKSENLEISKFGKDARRKMIEICLVKSASTSVALRNWALRLWEEIKKSCFFRLSVSYDRISSQLRGVYGHISIYPNIFTQRNNNLAIKPDGHLAMSHIAKTANSMFGIKSKNIALLRLQELGGVVWCGVGLPKQTCLKRPVLIMPENTWMTMMICPFLICGFLIILWSIKSQTKPRNTTEYHEIPSNHGKRELEEEGGVQSTVTKATRFEIINGFLLSSVSPGTSSGPFLAMTSCNVAKSFPTMHSRTDLRLRVPDRRSRKHDMP